MKVTVVTTVINRASELEVTMQSVLQHSRPGLDYIVIDGGSTDGSVEIIKKNAASLKQWVSEKDDGIYDAMNKAWSLADPESSILFIGAGDRLLALPENSAHDNDSDDILFGNVQLDRGQMFHARTGVWLKLFNSLHHQALLIPKRLHPDPPFDLSFPLYADFDFNQRLKLQDAEFRYCPGLSAYAAPGGVTENIELNELSQIIRKNYGLVWCGLSVMGFSLARFLPFLKRLRPIR